MTAEELIFATFPGTDELHRSVRLALLRVYHASRDAETETPFTVAWVARMIEDPPWSIWYGPEAALDLARHLRALAQELEKAAAALNSAQPEWHKFTDTNGVADVVRVGQPGATERETGDTGVPF